MPFSKVDGININYEIYGSGPRILFLHGIGADLKNPIGVSSSPLPKYFTCLAFEPRGIGESDTVEDGYTIADLAEEAAGLAASIGWDRFHVFAASMGGMIAQELAIRYPGAVDKLVMGVTHAGGSQGEAPTVIDKLEQMSMSDKLKLSDTRQDEAWAAAHPELVERFIEQTRLMADEMQNNPKYAKAFNQQMQAVLKHDTYDRLPLIQAKTFIFGGAYDGSCPPAAIQRLAGQIGGSRYELVESGHGNWFFDKSVWDMVITFLHKK